MSWQLQDAKQRFSEVVRRAPVSRNTADFARTGVRLVDPFRPPASG